MSKISITFAYHLKAEYMNTIDIKKVNVKLINSSIVYLVDSTSKEIARVDTYNGVSTGLFGTLNKNEIYSDIELKPVEEYTDDYIRRFFELCGIEVNFI